LSAPPDPSAAIGEGSYFKGKGEGRGEKKKGRKRKGRVRERDYLLYLTSG